MDYPQDVASRHYLNRSGSAPSHWALAVVIAQRLVEIQRWDKGQRAESVQGPKGKLIQLQTTEHRLVIITSKEVRDWNPKDGALAKRAATPADVPKEFFKAVPGEPQFRGQSDWCTVVIDGDVKACAPDKLYAQAKANWDALPPAKRTSLVARPALAEFGGHVKGAMRLLKYVAAALVAATPLAWYFLYH